MKSKVEERRLVGDKKFLTYAGTPNHQGARIYDAPVKAGEVTYPQFVKIVEGLKFHSKKKATAQSCARAWLRRFISTGIAHAVGEAPRKLTAKPFAPKVKRAKG